MADKTPVWFVTAASSGFGKAIAFEGLKRGHKVIATARRTETLDELKKAGAQTLQFDVTAPEDVIAAKVQEAVNFYGYLTHIINAAGYALGGAVESATEAELFKQYNTNVIGISKVAKAVTPHLRAQKFGVIANFGSVGSWTGVAGMGVYASTKWAVSALSETLTFELAPFGISVVCIEPGYFRTSFLNDGNVIWPANRLLDVYQGTPVEEYRALAESVNNKQPGDVDKAAPLIVDVMTRTGASKGREIPIRLALGTDCFNGIKQKLRSTSELLEEWKDISTATDY